jgi:hypothetical protein
MRYRFSHDPIASQDTWLRGNVLCDCSREKEEGAECCDYCRESRERDEQDIQREAREGQILTFELQNEFDAKRFCAA